MTTTTKPGHLQGTSLPAAGAVPVSAVDSGDRMKTAVAEFHDAGVGSIINGYVLTQAIFTFARSPFMEAFTRGGPIDVGALVTAHRLDHRHALGLMRYLATQGLFAETAGERFAATVRGQQLLTSGLGLLQMYRGGYGNLMEHSTELLHGTLSHGKDLERDGYWVGLGSSRITHAVLDEVPYRVLESKGVKRIADLGCGAGHFLIDFARRDPSHGGVGIDLSPEAVAIGNAAVKAAGLEDRVRFVVGDCFKLDVLAQHCADVEVFCAFAMEHELLRDGEAAVLSHIDGMAEMFAGRRYLLGEPMLSMTPTDGMFYWVHMLSHQGLPRNVAGWGDLLGQLGRAKLEQVFVPDHQFLGAYFDIRL